MILVTGAHGMLGSYFDGDEILKTDLDTLDIRDYQKIREMVGDYRPEIILHLAAETDVDLCEQNIDHAYKINTIGTQNVALVCQEFGSTLVYISTGAVFDGEKKEPYDEFDATKPVNIYGKTKLEGENIIKQLLKKFYIFRAGWMIGGGSGKDKKFVGKMVKLIKEREEISVVNDKFGSITYTKDFAQSIIEFIRTDMFGLYHMANKGVCSRYDIAVEITRILKKEIKINPVDSSKFPMPAPRGRLEAIRNYKLYLLGLDFMRDWKDALKDYLLSEWDI